MKPFAYISILIIIGLVTPACKKTLTSPGVVDGTVIQSDQISIAISNMTKVTDSKTYNYPVTDGNQDLTLGSQLTKGTATYTIKDGNGTQVYNQSYTGTHADVRTVTGAVGTWTIEIQLKKATGNIGCVLQH